MATQPDREKQQAFTQKVVGDLSATTTTVMCHLGDRLGLFKALDEHGQLTSAELAARASIDERYAREWLRAYPNTLNKILYLC